MIKKIFLPLLLVLLTSTFIGLIDIGHASAATYTVTSNANAGAGTLRQAITDANASVGVTDTIEFAIGTGQQSIAPTAVLPTISDPLIIDGTTQPGGATCGTNFTNRNLLVEINGTNIGDQTLLTFDTGSDGSTIKGLVINRAGLTNPGLLLQNSNDHIVQCNNIGTNFAGTTGLNSQNSGVVANTVSNLLVASPTLSANPTTHNISVTGVKSGLGVTFSPYCETSGSSNNTVSVVSPDGTGTTTPVGQRLTDYLTPAELSAGSASSGNAEAGTPGGNIYGARNSTIYCNQGRCSIGYNYGNAVQTMIKPNWGCTNGSGWSYKVVSGTKKDRWLCTQDYSVENDPVVRPWLRVVACESGGNWAINTGNGFYGGLQFDLQTWQSVGGQGYPHQNSAHEQAYRASLLRSQRGTQPWPICGKYYNG